MVDLNPPSTGDTASEPKTSLTTADIEAVVKAAVGFQANRNDEIKVLSATIPIAGNAFDDVISEVNQWEYASKIVRNSSLGLAAVVAVILIHLAFSKLKPVTVIVDRPSNDDGKRAAALSQLTEQIQHNPEAVSKILATWLRDSNTQPPQSKAA